jgi:shikimate kinase
MVAFIYGLFGKITPLKAKLAGLGRAKADGPDVRPGQGAQTGMRDARDRKPTQTAVAATARATLPPLQLRRSVVLVGMMGSGKTAVGRMLAARLEVPFLDSDAAIEEAAQASIAEIFARDGEAFFRDREAEVIARLLSGPPAVVSTGGGAFMAERNRLAIADQGIAIWLNADLETLWERVRHKDTRPLLRTADPRQTLAEIFERRVPIYRLAQKTVRVEPGYSVEETTDRVIKALRGDPAVLGPSI